MAVPSLLFLELPVGLVIDDEEILSIAGEISRSLVAGGPQEAEP